MPLSESIGQYTIGEGATPAAFGEYIRNMDLPQGSTRNPNGGIAPLDSNCN